MVNQMTMAAKTPMSDHLAQFWQLLETEHVRILIDIKRDAGGVPYWDAASFGDDVAKALVAQNAVTHDLLAALKWAVSKIGEPRLVRRQNDEHFNAYHKALTAIVKAEGTLIAEERTK
jgi:hypothetical protein